MHCRQALLPHPWRTVSRMSSVDARVLVRTLMNRKSWTTDLSWSTNLRRRAQCPGRYRETNCILGSDASKVVLSQRPETILVANAELASLGPAATLIGAAWSEIRMPATGMLKAEVMSMSPGSSSNTCAASRP